MESRISEYARRKYDLPSPETVAALTHHMADNVAVARKAHESANPSGACDGMCGCTCREEALVVAVAVDYAVMRREAVEKVQAQWLTDFRTWLQHLS